MQKNIILWVILVCLPLFAHSTDEAYFELKQQDNQLVYTAEFSWTLRTATLKAYPSLKENATQADFDEAIVDYLNKNIILSVGGKTLVSSQISPTKGDHSHSAKYRIYYNIASLNQPLEITNTCLFGLFATQKNHTSIFLPQFPNKAYTTGINNPSFILGKSENQNLGLISILFAGAFCLYLIWSKREAGEVKII